MLAARLLYQNQMTEVPKRSGNQTRKGPGKQYGWAYFCHERDFGVRKSVRTYQSLFQVAPAMTHYTPNTFYRNDSKTVDALRWLNALCFDIDVKNRANNGENEGLSYLDLLDRLAASGLPRPSLSVRTPSGGYHIYYLFDQPMRATDRAIKLYIDLQQAIARQIGSDRQAIGPERLFRIPTPENTIENNGERVSVAWFVEWLQMTREERPLPGKQALYASRNLFDCPAIQKLLEGAEEGKRDNTAYTLALVYRAEGYSQEETERCLQEWNTRLVAPLPKRQIARKVKSAFTGKAKGPSAAYIRMLSGMPFSYRPMEGKKSREERTYSHYEEWEADLLQLLEKEGVLCGSQRALAKHSGIPYSSFKVVLQRLFEAGKITVRVEGKGRSAKTMIEIVHDEKTVSLLPKRKKHDHHSFKKNELNLYTFMGQVVGGSVYRILWIVRGISLFLPDG